MKSWVLLGVIASISFGLSAIPLKYATGKEYVAAPYHTVIAGSLLGMMTVLIIYFYCTGSFNLKDLVSNNKALSLGYLSGAISVIGSLAVMIALKDPDTEVSKLMAIVSTSVLITAVFSSIFLRENTLLIEKFKILGGILLLLSGAKLIVR